jgi:hypothetical protein
MNCLLPCWLQVSQALLTPAIAILAVVIAFFQWKTAHQRAVIDQFDRRMKFYTGCRDVLHRLVLSPNATTDDNGHEFKRTSADAEFLFPPKVLEHLKNVENEIFDLATYNAEIDGTPVGQERRDLVDKRRIAINNIRKFYDEDFRSLVRRDMRLPQALSWRDLDVR